MKTIYFIFTFFILSTNILSAQTPPDTLWTKTFGGISAEIAFSVQQTLDGGYIIAGFTYSYGAGLNDFWLVKTDENGNEEWNQTYGGINYEQARSVQQTSDGGYIIAGFTRSYGSGSADTWLIKTDENGNEEWNQTNGGSEWEIAYSVQQTTDGGYIIAGYTESYGAGESDFWLIKTNENGNEEWNQTYGGINNDSAYSVQQTSDGGYIIAGITCSFGVSFSDFWLVKTDENGNEEWNQTYGGAYYEGAYSVQQTSDGGYIIAGFTCSFGSSPNASDFWLVKTDENGNEEWNRFWGSGYFSECARSVQQTIDGGYIIAGYTEFNAAGFTDYWLIKADANGNEEWNQTYGGSYWDEAFSVQQTFDGGYIIAGYTEFYGSGVSDFWLIRLGPEISIANSTIAEPLISNLSNYPNPFNPITIIKFDIKEHETGILTIFNIKGQLIESNRFESGKHNYLWDASEQASGIYLYKLQTESITETRKMLLVK